MKPAALACALAVAASPCVAQRRVDAAAIVSVVELRGDAGSGVERFSGPMIGAEGVVHPGERWELAVRVLGGALQARTPGGLSRDVGEVSAEVRTGGEGGLNLGVGAAHRVYATDLAQQGWTMVHLGAEARVPFIGGEVQAVAQGAVMPIVHVEGLPHPTTAYRLGTGMEVRRGRARLRVLYALERYNFPAGATPKRLEQVARLTLRGAIAVRGGL